MKNLNYGVIGNCRSAALISELGSLDWLCAYLNLIPHLPLLKLLDR